MGIPDHLTCLLRNLYAGQEATVRTGHGTIFSLEFLVVCSYKFTWASQVVLVAKNLPTQCRRHINKLRYVDDTTLMAESKEELKSFLIKVKEETERSGLKFNFKKTKIMA